MVLGNSCSNIITWVFLALHFSELMTIYQYTGLEDVPYFRNFLVSNDALAIIDYSSGASSFFFQKCDKYFLHPGLHCDLDLKHNAHSIV